MDLKKLEKVVAADDEGVVVTIYQKDGEAYLAMDGTESTMTVVGSESKLYKAAKRRATDRLLKGRKVKMSSADVEKNAVAMASSAVIDWHGWDSDKKELPCTQDNVRLVLGMADHILDQVQEAITSHADFSLAS